MTGPDRHDDDGEADPVVAADVAGLRRAPRVATMLAAYGAARLGLFALATVALRLIGLAPLTAVVLGALVSVVLSWPLLSRQRVAVASALDARRRARKTLDWPDPGASADDQPPT